MRRAAAIALLAVLAVAVAGLALWLSLPDVAELAQRNPITTALMERRVLETKTAGKRATRRWTWVKLDEIAPALAQAVILSEDAAFYQHAGFDWSEMGQAVQKNLKTRRYTRGASTLTQQLAKNLYLTTEKSLWRKAKEAVITVLMERELTKKRILTIYLNVVEWGNGIFGAEAAAQAHFGTSASRLSPAQAAVLAAMLPAPRRASLTPAQGWLRKRSRHVLDLMLDAKRITAEAHSHASAELERILAGAEGDEEDEPSADEEEP